MKCPDCGHHPDAEAEEFRSGGGWIVDHEWVDGVQVEEYRCPICRAIVNREENGSRDVFPDGGKVEEFFVVDEDRAAVVSGPHSQEEAVDEAVDGKHIVLTRGAIELFALTSSQSLSWEIEDPEVRADGGSWFKCACGARYRGRKAASGCCGDRSGGDR